MKTTGVLPNGGTDPVISSTGQRRSPGVVSVQPLEEAVRSAVTEALQEPELLVREYQRRISESSRLDSMEMERKQLSVAHRRVISQEDRITDAYRNEAVELGRYKAEMARLREHKRELDRRTQELERRQQQEQDSHYALEHLDLFCRRVTQGLDELTFEERQQLLRLVVEKVTVDNGRVRIETVIPPGDDKLRNRRPELVEG